jgi:calmodulin
MNQLNRQISKDRIAELKEAFDLFDEDRGGSISIEELSYVFRSIGYNPSIDELREMLKDDDRDDEENGEKKMEIFFPEFLKLIIHKSKDDEFKRELIEAFKLLDKDGHGLINVTELKELMLQFGETLSPEELETLLREADDDNDGYIEYEILIDKIVN